MDARMPAQPCLDFRRLMSGIVIENHMDAQALCDPAPSCACPPKTVDFPCVRSDTEYLADLPASASVARDHETFDA